MFSQSRCMLFQIFPKYDRSIGLTRIAFFIGAMFHFSVGTEDCVQLFSFILIEIYQLINDYF